MKKVMLMLFAAMFLFGRPIGLQAQEQDSQAVMWMISKLPGALHGIQTQPGLVPTMTCDKLADNNGNNSVIHVICVPLVEFCEIGRVVTKQHNTTAICRNNKFI